MNPQTSNNGQNNGQNNAQPNQEPSLGVTPSPAPSQPATTNPVAPYHSSDTVAPEAPQEAPAATATISSPIHLADATPQSETTANFEAIVQPEQTPAQDDDEDDNDDTTSPLEWQAPEYVHHDKSMTWYIILGGVTVVSIVAAIFFKLYFFAFVILVISFALGFFAARPPRMVTYRLSDDGLQVGDKTFKFSAFRSFGIITDDSRYSILLRPVKRFAPGVTIFFTDHEGEDVVDVLAAYLPMEEMQEDFFDRLMHKLRF